MIITDQKVYILALMSAGDDAKYTQQQLQMLCFLVDSESDEPLFNFSPDVYGPSDPEIYNLKTECVSEGLFVDGKDYQLTYKGVTEGKKYLEYWIDKKYAKYIHEINNYVRNHTIRELVSAIYEKYPDMATADSFFR